MEVWTDLDSGAWKEVAEDRTRDGALALGHEAREATANDVWCGCAHSGCDESFSNLSRRLTGKVSSWPFSPEDDATIVGDQAPGAGPACVDPEVGRHGRATDS